MIGSSYDDYDNNRRNVRSTTTDPIVANNTINPPNTASYPPNLSNRNQYDSLNEKSPSSSPLISSLDHDKIIKHAYPSPNFSAVNMHKWDIGISSSVMNGRKNFDPFPSNNFSVSSPSFSSSSSSDGGDGPSQFPWKLSVNQLNTPTPTGHGGRNTRNKPTSAVNITNNNRNTKNNLQQRLKLPLECHPENDYRQQQQPEQSQVLLNIANSASYETANHTLSLQFCNSIQLETSKTSTDSVGESDPFVERNEREEAGHLSSCPYDLMTDILHRPDGSSLDAVFDPISNVFMDRRMKGQTKRIDMTQALETGLLNPYTSAVYNWNLCKALILPDALQMAFINDRNEVLDTRTWKYIGLEEAASNGTLISLSKPMSLWNLLQTQHLYSHDQNSVNDLTGDYAIPLLHSIQGDQLLAAVDEESVGIRLDDGRKIIPFGQMYRAGGITSDGLLYVGSDRWMSLLDAFEAGVLCDLRPPYDLRDALIIGQYNPLSGLFRFDDGQGQMSEMTLKQACEEKWISMESRVVYNQVYPRRTESLEFCLRHGILNGQKSVLTLTTWQGESVKMDLAQAALQYHCVPGPRTRPTLGDVLLSPSYNDEWRRIRTGGLPGMNMSLLEAVDGELVDTRRTFLRDPSSPSGVLFNLRRAQQRGLIDLIEGHVYVDPSGTVITFKQALLEGILVEVPECHPKNCQPLRLSDLLSQNLVLETGGDGDSDGGSSSNSSTVLLFDPETAGVEKTRGGRSVGIGGYFSLKELLERGRVRKDSIVVRTPLNYYYNNAQSHQQTTPPTNAHHQHTYFTYDEAVKCAILNPVTGTVLVNQKRNIRLGLNQAWAYGFLTDHYPSVTLDQCSFLAEISDEKSLRRAIRSGKLDDQTPCLKFKGDVLSLGQALRKKLLVWSRKEIEPEQEKLIFPELNPKQLLNADSRINLLDAIHGGLCQYDPIHDFLAFLQPGLPNNRHLTLRQSLQIGLIEISGIHIRLPSSSKKDRFICFEAAIASGKVDQDYGELIPDGRARMSLLHAAEKKLLLPTGELPWSLDQLFEFELVHQDKFIEPTSGQKLTLTEALDQGLLDPRTTFYRNLQTSELIGIREAIKAETVSAKRSVVLNPESGDWISFQEAHDSGTLITCSPNLLFQDALDKGLINLKRCSFLDTRFDHAFPLEKAIRSNLLNCDDLFVKDTVNDSFVRIRSAIRTGLADLDRRVSVDPTSGQWLPLILRYPSGLITLSRQSFSFTHLFDNSYLNFTNGILTDPVTGNAYPIGRAISLNILDPTTVLLKDTAKRELLRFDAAIQEGVYSEQTARMTDSASGDELSLIGALSTGMILLPEKPLSLGDALQYGTYNAEKRLFRSPWTASGDVTFGEAVTLGILDYDSTMVKDPDGPDDNLLTLAKAVEVGLIDPVSGDLYLGKEKERKLSLADAFKSDLVIDVYAQDQVQLSYSSCEQDSEALLKRLLELERELGRTFHDQTADAQSLQQISNKITKLTELKMRINDMEPEVSRVVAVSDGISTDAADILSCEEFNSLRKHRDQLRDTFQNAQSRTDTLIEKLTNAMKYYDSFQRSLTDFNEWTKKTNAQISHVSDHLSPSSAEWTTQIATIHSEIDGVGSKKLAVVNADGLRLLTELKEYEEESDSASSHLMTSGMSTSSNLMTASSSSSTTSPASHQLDSMMDGARSDYENLQKRCSGLDSLGKNIGTKETAYRQRMDDSNRMLITLESRVRATGSESNKGDPDGLGQQLEETRSLTQQLMDTHSKVGDGLRESGDVLLSAMQGTHSYPHRKAEIDSDISKIDQSHNINLHQHQSNQQNQSSQQISTVQLVEESSDLFSSTRGTAEGEFRDDTLNMEKKDQDVEHGREEETATSVIMIDETSQSRIVHRTIEQERIIVEHAGSIRSAVDTNQASVSTTRPTLLIKEENVVQYSTVSDEDQEGRTTIQRTIRTTTGDHNNQAHSEARKFITKSSQTNFSPQDHPGSSASSGSAGISADEIVDYSQTLTSAVEFATTSSSLETNSNNSSSLHFEKQSSKDDANQLQPESSSRGAEPLSFNMEIQSEQVEELVAKDTSASSEHRKSDSISIKSTEDLTIARKLSSSSSSSVVAGVACSTNVDVDNQPSTIEPSRPAYMEVGDGRRISAAYIVNDGEEEVMSTDQILEGESIQEPNHKERTDSAHSESPGPVIRSNIDVQSVDTVSSHISQQDYTVSSPAPVDLDPTKGVGFNVISDPSIQEVEEDHEETTQPADTLKQACPAAAKPETLSELSSSEPLPEDLSGNESVPGPKHTGHGEVDQEKKKFDQAGVIEETNCCRSDTKDVLQESGDDEAAADGRRLEVSTIEFVSDETETIDSKRDDGNQQGAPSQMTSDPSDPILRHESDFTENQEPGRGTFGTQAQESDLFPPAESEDIESSCSKPIIQSGSDVIERQELDQAAADLQVIDSESKTSETGGTLEPGDTTDSTTDGKSTEEADLGQIGRLSEAEIGQPDTQATPDRQSDQPTIPTSLSVAVEESDSVSDETHNDSSNAEKSTTLSADCVDPKNTDNSNSSGTTISTGIQHSSTADTSTTVATKDVSVGEDLSTKRRINLDFSGTCIIDISHDDDSEIAEEDVEIEVSQEDESAPATTEQAAKRGLSDATESALDGTVKNQENTNEDGSVVLPEIKSGLWSDASPTGQPVTEGFEDAKENVDSRSQELQTLLSQSQGVKVALEETLQWLHETESKLSLAHPLPLNHQKLEQLSNDQQLMKSDIASKGAGLDQVRSSVEAFVSANPSNQGNQDLSRQLSDAEKRFTRVRGQCSAWGDSIEGANQILGKFNRDSTELTSWLDSTAEQLKKDGGSSAGSDALLDQTESESNERGDNLESLQKLLVEMNGLPNVTETTSHKDTMRGLERKWSRLQDTLTAMKKDREERDVRLATFHTERAGLVDQLGKLETRVDSALNEEPAVLSQPLHGQITSALTLQKEHSTLRPQVDALSALAAASSSASGTLLSSGNRSSLNSITGSPANRNNNNASDTVAEREAADLTKRFENVGSKLENHRENLQTALEKVEEYEGKREALNEWIDVRRSNIADTDLPRSKQEAVDMSKTSTANLEAEINKKRSDIEEVKIEARELTRMKDPVRTAGLEDLGKGQKETEDNWEAMQSEQKDLQGRLNTAENFYDSADALDKFLDGKEKMVNVLGAVSSNPHALRNQADQLNVIKDEITGYKPKLQRVNEDGTKLLSTPAKPGVKRKNTDDAADGGRMSPGRDVIAGHLDSINQKWSGLVDKVEEREQNIATAQQITAELATKQQAFMEWLKPLAAETDKLMSMDGNSGGGEERVGALEELRGRLDSGAHDLEELCTIAEQLNQLNAADPLAQAETANKIQTFKQPFQELQRKIESLEAAAKTELAEGKALESQAKDMADVSDKIQEKLAAIGPISANPQNLDKQVKSFEPIYEEAMERDALISQIRARGRELKDKSTNGGPIEDHLRRLEFWPDILDKVKDKKKTFDKTANAADLWVPARQKLEDQIVQHEAAMDKISSIAQGADGKDPKAIEEKAQQMTALEAAMLSSGQERKSANTLADQLTSVAGTDEDFVREAMGNLNGRWEALEGSVGKQKDALDNEAHQWKDLQAAVADLSKALNKVKDASAAPIDELSLAKLKDLLAQLEGPIAEQLSTCQNQCKSLSPSPAQEAASDELGQLAEDSRAAAAVLEEKIREKVDSEEAVKAVYTSSNNMSSNLGSLVSQLSELGPVARDPDNLRSQETSTKEFLEAIETADSQLTKTKEQLSNTLNKGSGGLLGSDMARNLSDQNERAEKDLVKVRGKAEERLTEIQTLLPKIIDALASMEGVQTEINDKMNADVLHGAVPGASRELAGQKTALDAFRSDLEPLADKIHKLTTDGNQLIQSAAPGVDTSLLQSNVNQLEAAYAELKSRIGDREKLLSGKSSELDNLAEAIGNMKEWLDDHEELVRGEDDPAIDSRVVRAQMQKHKLVARVVQDKQPQVDRLLDLADQLNISDTPTNGNGHATSNGNGAAENNHSNNEDSVRGETQQIAQRYNGLCEIVDKHKDKLEQALELSTEWQERVQPLTDWLDMAERTLQKLSNVQTDEDRLRDQIEEQKLLHEDIEEHRTEMDEALETGNELANLVSLEDAEQLQQRIETVAERYNELGNRSLTVAELLEEVSDGIGTFYAGTEKLALWIDEAEERLGKLDPISVFPEQLNNQSLELMAMTEELLEQQTQVAELIEEGRELCKHTSGDEAVALQGQLEGLRLRFAELQKSADTKLNSLEEAIPLSESFHMIQERLDEWLKAVESDLAHIDEASISQQQELIKNIEEDMEQTKGDFQRMNMEGGRLSQMSPGEGAETLDKLTGDVNGRFDDVVKDVNRRGERLNMTAARNNEIWDNMDDLADWFNEAAAKMDEAGAASANPEIARVDLSNQKLMNTDIISQKSRARDSLATAKKLIKDGAVVGDDARATSDKMEILKDLSERVAQQSSVRLANLEQALPLSVAFTTSLNELNEWLHDMEVEIDNAPDVIPGHHPDHLKRQQVHNNGLQQALTAHKAVFEGFEKTGESLSELCTDEDKIWIHEAMDNVGHRYQALREHIKARGEALNDALQESAQFSDKLDGMLAQLSAAAEAVRNPEPVSAHPDKIRGQIEENCALMDELEQKSAAYQAVRDAASDIIKKADPDDPAVSEIETKISELGDLWQEIQNGTESRGQTLADTLNVAQRFWDEMQSCISALKELERRLANSEPPACQPDEIQEQQNDMQIIKAELENAAPRLDSVKETGRQLIQLVGDPAKPEIKHRLQELDDNWGTVTDFYHARHENLIEAMEKAMDFHDNLRGLLEWLAGSEKRVAGFQLVSNLSLQEIRDELQKLEVFKKEVDGKAVEKEQLVHSAMQITEGTTSDQSGVVLKPIEDLTRRWEILNAALTDRQQKLERALLEMGQFEQAYDQLMDWMTKSGQTLDEIKASPGDLRETEIQLAKHRVLQNDIQAHQRSVDTINEAGQRLIALQADEANPEVTTRKLQALNDGWAGLLKRLAEKLVALEVSKSEAESFGGQLQDHIHWCDDRERELASTKARGGMPDTARVQLEDYLLIEEDIEKERPGLIEVLETAEAQIAASPDKANSAFGQQVKNLRKKWTQLETKSKDRKQKLEIALEKAEEFHLLITDFNEWLTETETTLNSVKPVSRLLEPITVQMEEHRALQEGVQAKRDIWTDLNNKGTQIQMYCEKKDAIPIKNLLVSAKHRFDKVCARTQDRTKALKEGSAEVHEWNDSWKTMVDWLDERLEWLETESAQAVSSSPDKIKQMLDDHRDFLGESGPKQASYDTTLRLGNMLRDKAIKPEQPAIQEMIDTLRTKWNSMSKKSIERQQQLEEALLFSGKFNETVAGLLDWISAAIDGLQRNEYVHGDLSTVNGLMERHQAFESELAVRAKTVETLQNSAEELVEKDAENKAGIEEKIDTVMSKWAEVKKLSNDRQELLGHALKDAEQFHKESHMMLEWLTAMEERLRRSRSLPENEDQLHERLTELEKLKAELEDKKADLESALFIGHDILSHVHPDAEDTVNRLMKVVQARWDEVNAFAEQREQRLESQIEDLKEQETLLDDMLKWLSGKERLLANAEEPPEQLEVVKRLIEEHGEFEGSLRLKQGDIDLATKGRQAGGGGLDGSGTGASDGDKKGNLRKQFSRTASENPKAKELNNRWKTIWVHAMERQRLLNDMLAYLQEMERLKNFKFEDWRLRYMDWMDHQKSRIMDFFRRQDRDNDGKIAIPDFINAVLASNFRTSRLEMEKVAEFIDTNKDGFIQNQEWIAALRPDKISGKPKSDNEKIVDEVKRQIDMCTCQHKYKINIVGEGKFKFGDAAKLRLVRILRSTVMVRVGGGWEALDEFLVKNDPCRAQGRTNTQLREKFFLAEGVSQSMQAFKERRSPMSGSHPSSSSTHSTPFNTPKGPITKIRQKTERSMPMTKSGSRGSLAGHSDYSDASSSVQSSDLLSRSSASKIGAGGGHRSTASGGGGGGGGSRPSSRSGHVHHHHTHHYRSSIPSPVPAGFSSAGIERPPSRAGSEVSDVSDAIVTPTRIPSLRGRKSLTPSSSNAPARTRQTILKPPPH